MVDERAVGETLNVGAGTSVSLREMAERIVKAAGSGGVETAPWPDGEERVETGDFLCDTSRIERLLGWRPCVDLEAGLGGTIGLYRKLLAEEHCS
jgi:nucleoside-diphosphate-sugar epimerase